jgi:hypothetical protein
MSVGAAPRSARGLVTTQRCSEIFANLAVPSASVGTCLLCAAHRLDQRRIVVADAERFKRGETILPARRHRAAGALTRRDFPQQSKRPRRANRGSPAFERKRGVLSLARPAIDRRRMDYRYFQCTQRRWPKPWVELKRRVHFMHCLPSGGWIVAPGLILPTFWTKDVDPKSSGESEEGIGPAETDGAAAKKSAPQRAPNKAVFKPLLIFSSHNFKFTLKR